MKISYVVYELDSLSINGNSSTVLTRVGEFYAYYKDPNKDQFYRSNDFISEEECLEFLEWFKSNKEFDWITPSYGTFIIQKEIYL